MHNFNAPLLRRAILAGSLLAFSVLVGGCADAPKKSAVPPAPPPPLTTAWMAHEAQGALKVCLRKEAFALNNGRRSVNDIASNAFAGCYPQVNDYLVVVAHQTRDPRAQVTLAKGALREAAGLARLAAKTELKN